MMKNPSFNLPVPSHTCLLNASALEIATAASAASEGADRSEIPGVGAASAPTSDVGSEALRPHPYPKK